MTEAPAGPPVIHAWRAAVNARDAEAALRLSAPDVRLGGPRGAASGHEVLRRWVAEAGIRLAPLGWQEAGPGVGVAEEEATWAAGGPPARVFVAYAVRGGLVAAVLRHDSREEALEAAERLRGG